MQNYKLIYNREKYKLKLSFLIVFYAQKKFFNQHIESS